MRIASTLVWETEGESHREEITLTDEVDNASTRHLVVVSANGERHVMAPEDLPKGSVLLVPSDASERDLAQIRRVGYRARRVGARSSRQAAIAQAEAELAEVAGRLRDELRRHHPELFDRRGRLRTRAYARLVSGRIGDRERLTREDLVALGAGAAEPGGGSPALDGA